MPKTNDIQLGGDIRLPILYEDRSVLAIDKPSGWMLIPQAWDKTARNLQLAIRSSLNAGDFWARSRGLNFLRFVHRLDADASGVLLFAKSAGALQAYSRLFASRRMEKVYLAVVQAIPARKRWCCYLKLAPDPQMSGRIKVDSRHGKLAETQFEVLQTRDALALVEARPVTGRTHQIRVHLAAAGHPILGDSLYGLSENPPTDCARELALRAVSLAYHDPFQKRMVRIDADREDFKKRFGFNFTVQA